MTYQIEAFVDSKQLHGAVILCFNEAQIKEAFKKCKLKYTKALNEQIHENPNSSTCMTVVLNDNPKQVAFILIPAYNVTDVNQAKLNIHSSVRHASLLSNTIVMFEKISSINTMMSADKTDVDSILFKSLHNFMNVFDIKYLVALK